MKKILVIYRVKDINYWMSNNILKTVWEPLGVKFQIFRQVDSNLIGYLAEINDQDLFDEVIKNSTLVSLSFKANGVITETIQILEQI